MNRFPMATAPRVTLAFVGGALVMFTFVCAILATVGFPGLSSALVTTTSLEQPVAISTSHLAATDVPPSEGTDSLAGGSAQPSVGTQASVGEPAATGAAVAEPPEALAVPQPAITNPLTRLAHSGVQFVMMTGGAVSMILGLVLLVASRQYLPSQPGHLAVGTRRLR